jgi:glycine/D-amino acid oxidase-like deaminating enzyme/nitrite reductase/ring-hydroxylating ferredoxin subunit
MTVWEIDSKKDNYPVLSENVSADVVIVGAGITGLTLAYLLSQQGRNTVVLEAGAISGSATAKSSAQLTVQTDYSFQKTYSHYNPETLKLVASSRVEAIDLIESISAFFDCNFKRVSSFYYSETNAGEIEEEYKYARMIGLDVQIRDEITLPLKIKKALEFKHDAIFNPVKYLYGLAAYITKNNNCKIYENSRVIETTAAKIVKTATGSVKANHIVFATHYPVFFNIHQTLAYPYRSYVIAARVNNILTDDSFWDTSDPYYYMRSYSAEGKSWLILGGADHKTGHTRPDAYKTLENYLQKHFYPISVDYRWSNQYYEPADGLPYIGKNVTGDEYIATGYSGVGLVYGTVAAMVLNNEISGIKNSYAEIYKARRLNILPSAGKFIKENVNVAAHYMKDLFLDEDLRADDLITGQGKVIKKGGKHYAIAKNDEDEVFAVSAVCPHLKCLVQWNTLDKTWDCPCHGSRFTIEGKIITGPAVHDLSIAYRKKMDENTKPQS